MKKSIRIISAIISLMIILTTMVCIPVNAEDTKYINVDISGNYNYDYAFEMLDILNEYRENVGLSKFVMEKSLLEQSMERAAEISVYYSHYRPNGKQGLGGETIAWHDKTPQQVVNGWMNSPKHRAILMRGNDELGTFEESHDNYNIGAGCFCDELGQYYWIFGFGIDDDISITNQEYSGIKSITKNIEVLKERITETGWTLFVDEQRTDREYEFGETGKIPYWFGTQPCYGEGPLDYSNFSFTSSDPSVVSVNEAEHYLTIGNAGTATLTATLKEDPTIFFQRTITVGPKRLGHYFTLECYTFYYDGTPKIPKVICSNPDLIEGRDYIVSCEDNIEASKKGKPVIITGIGNYTGTDTTCSIWIEVCTHEYSEKVTKYPTCTASGIKTYTCYMCSNSYTDTIPATGHKYSLDWTVDVQPTCKSEGSKSHHCTVCGAKKDTTVIPKSEHKYSVKITKAATCTETGLKTYTCSVCKDSYTETIPAKGHNYCSWAITKAATCTADGIKSRKCSFCGKTESQTIAKTGHNFITTVIKAATCTETGINKIACSVCGESRTENVYAKGHNYSTEVVKPSYEAQGCTIHTCSVCGDSYNDNYTDQLVTSNISKVKFTTSSNAVTMLWDKAAGVTGYRVYKYNTSTKKWQGIANTKNTSYTFTKLNSGKIYSFTIRAYTEENGKKYLSPKYTTFKTTTNPANITKINFKSSANAVKMSWNKVSGATGYRVYRYNTSTKKWQRIANIKGTSYTFSKLKAGTTYKFTVRAYKTVSGKTYLSPKYKVFTSSTNPATVSFKVTGGSKKATVKWYKVTGATGYKVYYKTSKNGKWIGLKTTNNKTTSYTKTGLKKGKTYYFTVKAYRTVGGKTYNGSYTAKSVKVK